MDESATSTEWCRHTWRITKYNPAFRSRKGHYVRNEWTDISDIGKNFDDGELTAERYLEVETAYARTAASFADELKVDRLTAVDLEGPLPPLALPDAIRVPGEDEFCRGLTEGAIIDVGQIVDAVRLILRSRFWARLRCDERLEVEFGYDYYMYVYSTQNCPRSVNLA